MDRSQIRRPALLGLLCLAALGASCGGGGGTGDDTELAAPPLRPQSFVARNDLGVEPHPGRGGAKGLLLRFVQITDIHITDENFHLVSPALEDLIDQFGDEIGFGGFKRSKAQEKHDVDVLSAFVATVNAMDPPADYVVSTGDTTDTALESEAVSARDALNGLEIPWLEAVGNHDDLVLGNIPPDVAHDLTGGSFLELKNFVSLFFGDGHLPSLAIADGHGFALNQHYNGTSPGTSHGYYAFDAAPSRNGNPAVRFVVLETTRFSGGAEGSVGTEQMDWLTGELEASRSKLVIVFGHHAIADLDDGQELSRKFHRYPNVVAHIAGHTHIHKVAAGAGPVAGEGFWAVQTSSLIDFPQQARVLEIESNGDGTGRLVSYVFNERAKGQLAEDAMSSYNAAVSEGFDGSGDANDRDVELAFAFQP